MIIEQTFYAIFTKPLLLYDFKILLFYDFIYAKIVHSSRTIWSCYIQSGKSLMPTVSQLAKDREGFDSFQPQQVPTTTTAMLGRNDMSFSALNAASVQERGHSHSQNQMSLFQINPRPCSLQHIPVPLNSMPNNAVHGPFDREYRNIGSVKKIRK